MSIQMPFKMVQKYKIRQLGLYFDNFENIHSIENIEQNNQYTWLDKYNLIKPYNKNIHQTSHHLTSHIETDTNARKLLEKAEKIKKLKIKNPVVICHWDDETFIHCDEIYAKMQYVKYKMILLKLREPVKNITWDTIESDPFSNYVLEKESENQTGSQETNKKKDSHFLYNSDKTLQLTSENVNIHNERTSGTLFMYNNAAKPMRSSSYRRMVFHVPPLP